MMNQFSATRNDQEIDVQLMANGVTQNWAVAEGVQGSHDVQGGN